MNPGKLYGVSVGPGDNLYLTLRAIYILYSVEVSFIFISQKTLSSVSQIVVISLERLNEIRLRLLNMLRDKTVLKTQVLSNTEVIIIKCEVDSKCVFATLDAAIIYSTFEYVLKHIQIAIPQVKLKIVPDITSFTSLTAKAEAIFIKNGEHSSPFLLSVRDGSLTEFAKNATIFFLKTYRTARCLSDVSSRKRM